MAVLQSQLRLTLHDQVSGRMKAISAQMAAFQTRMRAMTAPFMGMTARLAAVGGGYLAATAGMRGTVGAAIAFESAFADVRKVVDASDEQFANMSRTIKQMSTQLPLTAVEISQLFAAAGESGIATNELKSFSEMAARVGIAFDMSAGQAGDSLAKLKAQLGLNVEETGLMADAINHLSNNMAAKAPQITDYMLRVGKFAEMGGFHRDQIAAIGAAMIASGAQAETAGTAMMNVVRKMTAGGFAKKDQKEAAAALGLHLPTLAKQMQKDAPKALKTVLKAIAKVPEEKQLALLSKFFGDEARAFAPLVGNIDLLDKALDSVADRTKYAGSAFKEFVARADTTENALKLLRNRIAFQFENIGAAWLPDIKEATAAIGGVLDTLGDRVSIFDKLEWGAKGFLKGLGYDGSIRNVIDDLGDLLFGKIDPSKGADQLGMLFAKMEGWGKSVRELSAAIRDNPIAQFIGEMAGHGFKLFVAAAGFTMLAGALSKLAKAAWMLSGAGVAVGIIKSLAGIGGALFKTPGLPGGGKPTAGGAPTGVAGGVMLAMLRQFAARIPQVAAAAAAAYGAHQFVSQTSADNAADDARSATPRRGERDSMDALARQRAEIEDMHEDRLAAKEKRPAVGFFNSPAWGHVQDAGNAVTDGLSAVGDWLRQWDQKLSDANPGLRVNTPGKDRVLPGSAPVPTARPDTPSIINQFLDGMRKLNGEEKVVPSPFDAIKSIGDKLSAIMPPAPPTDPIPTLLTLRDAIHQPSGTMKVEVTNQQPPSIHLGPVTVYATTNADPQEIANATAARVSAALQSQFSNAHLA